MFRRTTEQPRLNGHRRPYYDTTAKDVFLKVLTEAIDIEHPRLACTYSDPMQRVRAAALEAMLWANDPLKELLNSYVEELSCFHSGESTPEEVKQKKDAFTEGCRIALGTND